MISITTLEYDYVGHIQLNPEPDSARQVFERRLSKAATLDGLSSISDFGFTASDNIWTIKVRNATEADRSRLIYLIKSYQVLRIANEDGVFIGAMQSLRLNIEPIEFIFTIRQQVA